MHQVATRHDRVRLAQLIDLEDRGLSLEGNFDLLVLEGVHTSAAIGLAGRVAASLVLQYGFVALDSRACHIPYNPSADPFYEYPAHASLRVHGEVWPIGRLRVGGSVTVSTPNRPPFFLVEEVEIDPSLGTSDSNLEIALALWVGFRH